ncbi:MAG: MOSC domain-containing protein [Herpetosiphonaceae bacterium]|nr:MOSC domain-containing protein [Herpetosiphonaceae bacterium]
MNPMHVAGLYTYPIKSCRGTALARATLDEHGIRQDRRFMVVTPSGDFLTQRQQPSLALVVPQLADGVLSVDAPGLPPLVLREHNSGERVHVTIWRDRCVAIDQGDDAASWFTTFLGTACRLVWMPDDTVRPVDLEYGQPNDQVSFADGFPVLLTNEASLDDLNNRLDRPLPMDRFRPNIVVAGTNPYAEDQWHHVQIGSVAFAIVKPCVRCAITTTNQQTAERGLEPLRTLASYHRSEKGALFGQNLIHRSGGTINVGDAVVVDE